MTIVHHPHDARIYLRQIGALLEAGWEVTYAAPFTDYGLPARDERLTRTVDLRRSSGRRRLGAAYRARSVLRELGPQHDLVLLHDPELVPWTLGLSLPPVVWDVHEDTPATIAIRTWVPDSSRSVLARAAVGLERHAERRMHLLLADDHYADRFARAHPVIRNTTVVPDAPVPAGARDAEGVQRVMYLGSVTVERGVHEMVALGGRLRAQTGGRVRLEVIGPAHGAAVAVLEAAVRRGDLRWHGFVPGHQALQLLDGALAGLSLLHDEANFRPSMPTKVIEYLAHGVPAITTPLPVPARLVERSGAGVVVPFGDVEETLATILRWSADPGEAATLGSRGHAVAREEFDWTRLGPDFVTVLEQLADDGGVQSRP
ncbi:glycosyltransferase family 4 protein [Serinicoccus kebangsaanensis]|uniref:glycosyltransferase family 4 protein n=1 Tax=Serinicoccus kebangsaanensis TaxID=2602069 RepID=UPI00192D2C0A|nr:glycosyltransferase family 4 protein [Serinicoccus kebangsaanensis]